jgi:xanthine dehydrogenase YagS FAD-binding subunit
MTVLEPGQLLTAIRIPSTWSGATFHFEKVADRNTFDFALVSLAGAMRLRGEVIEDVRLVAGAVECVPRRLREAEDGLRGASIGPESAEAAAAVAVQGADPLRHNGYKVPLLSNLVARAVPDAVA